MLLSERLFLLNPIFLWNGISRSKSSLWMSKHHKWGLFFSAFAVIRCFFAPDLVFAAQEPPLEAPYTRTTETIKSPPLEQPESISEDGEYFYKPKSANDAMYYDMTHLPPIKRGAFFRISSTSSFQITGDNGRTYQQVYGEDPGIGIVFDYEWPLFVMTGKWSLKASTGFTFGNGRGQFADPTNAALEPKEKYLILISPHTALLNYKMTFSDTQLFIPYVEAGPGFYTYIEHRNDGDKTGFGGAPVFAAAGGFLVSLSLLDRNAAGLLYDDYGINHLWFDVQFRRNQGLDKGTDFSSNVISTGFGFAF